MLRRWPLLSCLAFTPALLAAVACSGDSDSGGGSAKVGFESATSEGSADEGTVTVKLTRASAADAPVNLSVNTGGTAVASQDYRFTSGGAGFLMLTFPAGATELPIEIELLPSAAPGEARTLTFDLMPSGPTPAPIDEARKTHTLTIANSFRAGLTLSVPRADAYEGAENPAVDFFLSGSVATDVLVHFTLSGTATAGADFTPSAASPLRIPAGQSSASLSFTLAADGTFEPQETIIVTVDSVEGGAALGPDQAPATINLRDANDLAVVWSAPSTALVEDQGAVVITATIPAQPAALNLAYTLQGTLQEGTHFTRADTSGQLQFAAGASTATLTLNLSNDEAFGCGGALKVAASIATFAGDEDLPRAATGALDLTLTDDDELAPGRNDITIRLESPQRRSMYFVLVDLNGTQIRVEEVHNNDMAISFAGEQRLGDGVYQAGYKRWIGDGTITEPVTLTVTQSTCEIDTFELEPLIDDIRYRYLLELTVAGNEVTFREIPASE